MLALMNRLRTNVAPRADPQLRMVAVSGLLARVMLLLPGGRALLRLDRYHRRPPGDDLLRREQGGLLGRGTGGIVRPLPPSRPGRARRITTVLPRQWH